MKCFAAYDSLQYIEMLFWNTLLFVTFTKWWYDFFQRHLATFTFIQLWNWLMPSSWHCVLTSTIHFFYSSNQHSILHSIQNDTGQWKHNNYDDPDVPQGNTVSQGPLKRYGTLKYIGNISELAVLARHSLGSSHLKRFPALVRKHMTMHSGKN